MTKVSEVWEGVVIILVTGCGIISLGLLDDPLNLHLDGMDKHFRLEDGVRIRLLRRGLEVLREGVRLNILGPRSIG